MKTLKKRSKSCRFVKGFSCSENTAFFTIPYNTESSLGVRCDIRRTPMSFFDIFPRRGNFLSSFVSSPPVPNKNKRRYI